MELERETIFDFIIIIVVIILMITDDFFILRHAYVCIKLVSVYVL